jgi:hypothetical protein
MWFLFGAWLILGIIQLCGAGNVSKVQYACVWIPFMIQLFTNAIERTG